MSEARDVRVVREGSVWLFTPESDAARGWVEENVPLEDWQWLGTGFGVEWRYGPGLVAGMLEAGLVVEDDGGRRFKMAERSDAQ